MRKRLISLVLSAVMTVALSNSAFAVGNNIKSVDFNTNQRFVNEVKIKNDISQAMIEQGIKDENSNKLVELLVIGDGNDISKELIKTGAKVNKMSSSIYVVEIPANKAVNITKINGIIGAGTDKIVDLPKPINSEKFNLNGETIYYPNLEYSNYETGMSNFWESGYDGKDVTIAIVDTGVEVNNELLTLTNEGKIKMVDVKDFWKASGSYSEGDVISEEFTVIEDEEGKYIQDKGLRMNLPESVGEKVLLGYYDESPLVYDYGRQRHDVNNNGSTTDLFPVVASNYDNDDKLDDMIFVDTDSDYDFTDEKEMGIYGEIVESFKDEEIFEMENGKPILVNEEPVVKTEYSHDYARLTNNFEDKGIGYNSYGTSYNFAISDVEFDSNGNWLVNIFYDGNSHGTHVAGDAAANGYKALPFVDTELQSDGTLKGAAPAAQIMGLRVFQSDGGTPTSAYLAASEYACENGADIINMSIGSLQDINDAEAAECKFINQLSEKYGVIFCLSAGNEGPFTNSVGKPGVAQWPITVGAYNPAWINYGNSSVENSLWYFSSRGPSEDGRLKPTIVAPGSMIASAPMWKVGDIRSKVPGGGSYVGYSLENGTSMASPYTAGAVATLLQALREKQLPEHPLLVKEAIFETGRKDIDSTNYKPTEIGGGMINTEAALAYIEKLNEEGLDKEDLVDAEGNNIDRSKMIPKVQVGYTERLTYLPEGLYVRSGMSNKMYNPINSDNLIDEGFLSEYPITITNTMDRKLELDLTKESYSFANDWLTLNKNNLVIEKGQNAELVVKIDESKLEQGVNSCLIKMDDPSTPMQEGYIPITIVNYKELNVENPVITESDNIGFRPGTTYSHFINIPYGTSGVEIDIEMTDRSDSSNLLPLIGKPSGIEETNVPGADWLYSVYNKRTITLNNPEAGTWEIGLFSGLIDDVNSATGKHKLTYRLKGMSLSPDIISFSGQSGEYRENDVEFKVLNATYKEMQNINLKTTGLVNKKGNIISSTENIINQEDKIVHTFTIPKNDMNIYARFNTCEPQYANDDIDMTLYKVITNGNGTKSLGEVIGTSGNSNSDEEIYVEALDPGEYALTVFAYDTADQTSFKYSYSILNSSDSESVIDIKTSDITLDRDIASFKVGLRVPTKTGEYMGFLYAEDESGKIIAKAKIKALAQGTENNLVIDTPEIVREGKDFNVSIDGDIKDTSMLNNIYGAQFEVSLDNNLQAMALVDGDIFKGTDVKVLKKQVNDNKVSYAVAFINKESKEDATGMIAGNIAAIRVNAQEKGIAKIDFNKLLIVNHLGDEIALNTIFNDDIGIANPDVMDDGAFNICDIAKLASRIGKSIDDQGYIATLDFNGDNKIDYKELNFLIECFVEDN